MVSILLLLVIFFCKNNVSKVSGAGEKYENNDPLKNTAWVGKDLL